MRYVLKKAFPGIPPQSLGTSYRADTCRAPSRGSPRLILALPPRKLLESSRFRPISMRASDYDLSAKIESAIPRRFILLAPCCYGTYCFSGSCTKFTYSCSARQFSYYVFSSIRVQPVQRVPRISAFHCRFGSGGVVQLYSCTPDLTRRDPY